MDKWPHLHFDEAKLKEIEAAVTAGEILIYPKPLSGPSETFLPNERVEPKANKVKTKGNTKKEQKDNFLSTGFYSMTVDSTNKGVLLVPESLLEGLKIEAGYTIQVEGVNRKVTNVTYYTKKKLIAIATKGGGYWPLGVLKIVVSNHP